MRDDVTKHTGVDSGDSVAEAIAPEYRLDYSGAKPNRFAARMSDGVRVIVLDADVAEVFSTAEQVNAVLRALIRTMPAPTR